MKLLVVLVALFLTSVVAARKETMKSSLLSTNDNLIQVKDGDCGPNGATKEVTAVSGPNGHIDWMNCGFEAGGWTPPQVTVKDLVLVELEVALQDSNSPFKACKDYIALFNKYGNDTIPPIILAAFAMQESSCKAETVGGGLMQINEEKCRDAPDGNCLDPDFNIMKAASYFAETLSSVDGNVFLAVGTYNGWKPRLTKSEAFAAAESECCVCQKNGDYLMQFFNGWVLNIDPYAKRLGKYFNLDSCGQ